MTLFGIRPAFWPTVMTLPALLILIALGGWQTQRLIWKEGLIAERTARAEGPAVSFPKDPGEVEEWDFRAVTVTGTFQHDREMYLMARTLRGNVGFHVITPLSRSDGGTVMVNRGWVPLDRKDPTDRAEGQVAGEVSLTGVARSVRAQHWLQPDNEPDKNQWFFMDVAAMAAHHGLSDTHPLYFEVGPAENAGGLPIGGQAKIILPNNHLQYAVTWFSFAITLLVIYLLYHRRLAAKQD